MAFNYDNGGARASRLGYKQTKPAGPLKYSPVASALSGYSPLSAGSTAAPRTYQAVAPAPAPESPVGAPTAPRPIHPPVSEAPLQSPIVPYDINTDPILQQITSYLGKSDEDAKAAALKQRKDLLLGYGDSGLINALLPGENDLASAASSNPTSTLAGLKTQRDRNSHSLTEALSQGNLFYSGNRIVQEQQAAQDYLSALAQAAAGVQGGLGTIDSNLAAALGDNAYKRIGAMGDASNRHKDEHTGGEQPPTILPTPPVTNGKPDNPALPMFQDPGYTPLPQLSVAAGNNQPTPGRAIDPTGRTKSNPTLSIADLFRLLGG